MDSDNRSSGSGTGTGTDSTTPSYPQATGGAGATQPASSSFFSSFFKKATTTLESSLHAAQQNGSEALSNAQQQMSAASSSAISNLQGLVQDFGTTFNKNGTTQHASSSSPRTNGTSDGTGVVNTSIMEKTVPLKPLKMNASNITPLLLITQAHVPILVSQSHLHLFTTAAQENPSLPTLVPLNVAAHADAGGSSTEANQNQNQSRNQEQEANENQANQNQQVEQLKPVNASHAVYVPSTTRPKLAIAHDDGSILIFSLSPSRVAAFEAATSPHPSPTTALSLAFAAAARADGATNNTNNLYLIVGRRDGSVHIVDTSLRPVINIATPDMCVDALTPSLTSSSAVRIRAYAHSRILIAYDDGSTCTFKYDVSNANSVVSQCNAPFVTHAGIPSSTHLLFNGLLLFTGGNTSDKCLAVFDAHTGRCLCRRSLPFIPSYVHKVESYNHNSENDDMNICPSRNTFVVGGNEGQVEIYRINALSVHKIDIKLVFKLSDKQRSLSNHKKKHIIQISYSPHTYNLHVINANCDIKRWKLGKTDASHLCLIEEDRWIGSTYTADNIHTYIQKEEANSFGKPSTGNGNGVQESGDDDDPSSSINISKRNHSTGITKAQNILASILDERESSNENRKDELVTSFQRMQTEMMEDILNAEKQFRRAKRRIFNQFSPGLTHIEKSKYTPDSFEGKLSREVKKCAAFEVEFITKRHNETIINIEKQTVDKMKKLLSDFLTAKSKSSSNSNGSRSNPQSLILQQALRDVEMLGTEEAEVEVD